MEILCVFRDIFKVSFFNKMKVSLCNSQKIWPKKVEIFDIFSINLGTPNFRNRDDFPLFEFPPPLSLLRKFPLKFGEIAKSPNTF